MNVYGAEAVDAVNADGAKQLVVELNDLVTPLARERARELSIDIVVAGAGSAPRARTLSSVPAHPTPRGVPVSQSPQAPRDAPTSLAEFNGEDVPAPLSPPSPALYRRGAPLPAAVRVIPRPAAAPSSSSHAGSERVGRVTVVGAGNVGMIAAMRLAEADVIDEVVLVDIAGQRAAGIALDISHASPLLGFSTKLRGVNTLAEAGPSDYVVITAGRARTPGMSRSDLVGTNAAIVGALTADAVAVSPDTVLLIVTNPLDEMTQHAWQVSGLPTDRVIGMAGVLDSSRFEALTALAAQIPSGDVSALALGSHGDEMVLPLSQAQIRGRSISDSLPRATVDGLVDRARNSGAEVVGLLESGSAFFAPGLSAARMVLAMIAESGEVLAATVAPHGQYGISSGYVGLPVRLDRSGLAEIVELPLTPSELTDLQTAAKRIAERVGTLEAVGAR